MGNQNVKVGAIAVNENFNFIILMRKALSMFENRFFRHMSAPSKCFAINLFSQSIYALF